MSALLLAIIPSLVLIAGGCALAVWAKGLKDEQSTLISRLTTPPVAVAKAQSERQTAQERGNDEGTPA